MWSGVLIITASMSFACVIEHNPEIFIVACTGMFLSAIGGHAVVYIA
jgi:hypothetical protein